jgi:Na+-translocating ferredoxin:NAD+ oxidoreductase RnfG subunit
MSNAELIFRLALLALVALVGAGFIAGVFSVAESGIAMSFAAVSQIIHEVLK